MEDKDRNTTEAVDTEKREGKRGISPKMLIFLQLIVVFYTFSGVSGKVASAAELLSPEFLIFFGVQVLILAVYALMWQQVIKRVPLSLAYANRAVALIWSMLWAVVFFHEGVSLQNIIGVLTVIAGTVIVNTDGK